MIVQVTTTATTKEGAEMEIKTAKVDAPWGNRLPGTGWGNGYIGLPVGHPWYNKDYDDIDVSIHGGLTYSEFYNPVTKKVDPGTWWIGFDTAHFGDNKDKHNKAFVEAEIKSLKEQAEKAAQ